MHPLLIKMGLIKYADDVRDRGDRYLFPELEPDRRGYRADRAQKWFSRFMEKAGAPLDLVRYMGGWTGSNVSENYGGAPSPRVLARWIKKIDYSVDLSHLHATGKQGG